MIICILGRQPRLALAELEARFGAHSIQPLGKEAALVEVAPHDINHAHLGGTVKIAKLLTTIHSTKWSEITDYYLKHFPQHLPHIPEGRLTIGLSTYGIHTTAQRIKHVALQFKKVIRSEGRSVRIVSNTDTALNSAQVLHNNLTDTNGIELLSVAHGGRTYIAQTVSVQDIESYSRRDFSRPKRDTFVGMLPPKLAQIMINLANPRPHATILDPFCGTGVVLMEAALQGYAVEGSDLNQKMVDYTRTNLQWLSDTFHIEPKIKELCRTDATTHEWRKTIDAVVCETYLGKPFSRLPDSKLLQTAIDQCDTIVRDFLKNLHHQLTQQARCCIAVPAWATSRGFHHLPVVDDLKKMGYNRVSFSYAHDGDLIYHRPGQVVARELLVLTLQEVKE